MMKPEMTKNTSTPASQGNAAIGANAPPARSAKRCGVVLRVQHRDGQRRDGAQDLKQNELGQGARFARRPDRLCSLEVATDFRKRSPRRLCRRPQVVASGRSELRRRRPLGMDAPFKRKRPHAHIVLLGDSIFDNGAYVRRGEPDVVRQLRARLPAGSEGDARGGRRRDDGRRRAPARAPPRRCHPSHRQRRRQRRPRQYRRARGFVALDRRRADAACRDRRRLRARLSRHARLGPRPWQADGALHDLRPALPGPALAAPRRHRTRPVQRRHHPRPRLRTACRCSTCA